MVAMIGTWKMCYAGLREAYEGLQRGGTVRDAVELAVTRVEDNPAYGSVGYGGLPARDGHVTLDAAYMDGQTLRYGGVLCVENVRNPIRAAIRLSERKINCLLAGRGAEAFAVEQGLPLRDMRTEASQTRWRKALRADPATREAYRGHDTVCVLALDASGGMAAGVSTSGLFMKEPGRIGDSPVIGSGFYCDARYGAAAATGLGEDVMRGCLSYEVVARMREGATPQQACDAALQPLRARLRELGEPDGGISLIALNPAGQHGAATTIELFPFAAAGGDEAPALYAAAYADAGTQVRLVPEAEVEGLLAD